MFDLDTYVGQQVVQVHRHTDELESQNAVVDSFYSGAVNRDPPFYPSRLHDRPMVNVAHRFIDRHCWNRACAQSGRAGVKCASRIV